MKSKIVNLIVFSIMLAFSIFFGIENYKKNTLTAQQDALFETQLSQSLSSITKSIADDINITNSNKSSNNSSSTSNSPNAGDKEVNFTNFYQMYEFAVKKYNRASYVYTAGSGSALLSGSAPDMGLNITDKTMTLNFVKAKELNERYFTFRIRGKLVEGFNEADISTIHYTEGATYQYAINGDSPISLSQSNYFSRLNWDMTAPFHLPNETVSAGVKESEIVAFYFDETKKEYVAQLSFDTKNFQSNFASIIGSITNASAPVTFSKIEVTVRVDKNGNFKSITFSENFNANIVYKGIKINGSVKTSYTESFLYIDNGFVDVKNPFAPTPTV